MRFPPPVAELIGIRLVSMGGGQAEFALDAEERHTNPMGTVHGGILVDLADAAMGSAYISTLDEGRSFTTVELKINYLRAVRAGTTLFAAARVVHEGSRIGLTECDVRDGEGRLVARATSTCITLGGDSAADAPVR